MGQQADRNAQFENIAKLKGEYVDAGLPVISIDTKKKSYWVTVANTQQVVSPVLWFFGSLVLWFFGSLVLWFFGSLVLWFFGAPALLQRAILIMWLAEVLLLSIETGENFGTNTDPDFQFVASVFSR